MVSEEPPEASITSVTFPSMRRRLIKLSLAVPPFLAVYFSNHAIFLMRMITSAEIKRRSDFFEPFVMVRT